MAEKQVTDSWIGKNYEPMLTEFYFDILSTLRATQTQPVLENLKASFSAVRSFAYGVVYKKHLEDFNDKAKPKLTDIKKIVYGNPQDITVLKLCRKYGVNIRKERMGIVIENGQKILDELWEVFFLVKQWAYEEGFFAKKPWEKRQGTDAISDVLDM